MQQHALFISAHGPIPSSCEVTFLILFIKLFIFGSWILQTKDLNTASPFLSDYGLSEGFCQPYPYQLAWSKETETVHLKQFRPRK